jgi:molybdopterin-guanine dinucleotide biosynthesis protein MobB
MDGAPDAPPVIGLVGSSGSGKTTLIERLVPILRSSGRRVGVLKHARPGFDVDQPGKDSFRAREAGAAQVLVASHRRWALMADEEEPADEPRLAQLVSRFTPGAVDLVLAEGFAHEAYAKIEVYRPALGRAPKCWPADPTVVAVATDAAALPLCRVLQLDLNDPRTIGDFILSWIGHGVKASARRHSGPP